MVELRSSTRPQRGISAQERSKMARPSSSSARGAVNLQSDENAGHTRRVLGDIKNVAADRSQATASSRVGRKPLTDRNAAIVEVKSEKVSGMKARPGSSATKGASAPTSNKAGDGRAKRDTSRQAAAKRQITASRADDTLSAQIESAARRADQAIPSHDELTTLPPQLNSDDLEYLDVDVLLPTQPGQTATASRKRDQRAESKDGHSDAGVSASHGSSDKENMPPKGTQSDVPSRSRRGAQQRAEARRELEGGQPTHSTPIAHRQKAARNDEPSTPPPRPLDEMFPADSDRSSDMDSPGAARRAAPLTESEQQLLDSQDHGVSKVMAWKAAGFDPTLMGSPPPKIASSVTDAESWPVDEDLAPRSFIEGEGEADEADDFGFSLVERKVRDRRMKALAKLDSSEGEVSQRSDDHADHSYADVPTDPFNASDDRRLADTAFARMSSPDAHQLPPSSPEAASSVADARDDALHAAPDEQSEEDAEGEPDETAGAISLDPTTEKLEADASDRRTTRSSKKQSEDVAAEDRDSSDLDLPPPSQHPKSYRQASKARLSSLGIPLKRNEKKEQEVLERLAELDAVSPGQSSAPSSPQAKGKGKSKTFRMDDALEFLPRRNANGTKTAAPSAKGKTAGKAKSGKRQGTKASTKDALASMPKAKATRGSRGRKEKSPAPEPEEAILISSDAEPAAETPKRSTLSAKRARKDYAVSEGEELEEALNLKIGKQKAQPSSSKKGKNRPVSKEAEPQPEQEEQSEEDTSKATRGSSRSNKGKKRAMSDAEQSDAGPVGKATKRNPRGASTKGNSVPEERDEDEELNEVPDDNASKRSPAKASKKGGAPAVVEKQNLDEVDDFNALVSQPPRRSGRSNKGKPRWPIFGDVGDETDVDLNLGSRRTETLSRKDKVQAAQDDAQSEQEEGQEEEEESKGKVTRQSPGKPSKSSRGRAGAKVPGLEDEEVEEEPVSPETGRKTRAASKKGRVSFSPVASAASEEEHGDEDEEVPAGKGARRSTRMNKGKGRSEAEDEGNEPEEEPASKKQGRSSNASASKKGKGAGASTKRSWQDDDDDDDDDESDEGAPNTRRIRNSLPSVPTKRKGRASPAKKKGKKQQQEEVPDSDEGIQVDDSPIHSDDSERTKRMKEFRAADKYALEVEMIL